MAWSRVSSYHFRYKDRCEHEHDIEEFIQATRSIEISPQGFRRVIAFITLAGQLSYTFNHISGSSGSNIIIHGPSCRCQSPDQVLYHQFLHNIRNSDANLVNLRCNLPLHITQSIHQCHLLFWHARHFKSIPIPTDVRVQSRSHFQRGRQQRRW